MAHDLAGSGKSEVREVREVDFSRKRSRRRVFSKEFGERSHLGWTRQGSRCQTVKPILFSISGERRGVGVEDVVRPFGVLENILGVLLDGLPGVDDRRVVGTVISILTGQ